MKSTLQKPKQSREEVNLKLFKNYISKMRNNQGIDFENLRRKIRAYCKTSSIGNYHRIVLKHSKYFISFSIYKKNILDEDFYLVRVHFSSKYPKVEQTILNCDSMIFYCSNDKDFLHKIVIKHKLFENA